MRPHPLQIKRQLERARRFLIDAADALPIPAAPTT